MKSLQVPRSLAFFSVFFALVVVLLGAYTRLTEAGLGCPDWPGCYGHLTVPSTPEAINLAKSNFPEATLEQEKAWIEMIHRYFAGALGLLVLTLTFLAIRHRRHYKTPIALSLLLCMLVVLQAALGMWTVTWSLHPMVVTSHLFGGFLTLSLLWCLQLEWNQFNPIIHRPIPGWLSLWALCALIVLMGQIFLGAWTSSNYAALACIDFPTCHQHWIPPLDFENAFHLWHPIGQNYQGGILDSVQRITIHFSHRLGAILALCVIGGLAVNCMRHKSRYLRTMGKTIATLLCIQVLLGVSNVVFHLPISVAVAHNGVAALLLVTLITLYYSLQRKPRSYMSAIR